MVEQWHKPVEGPRGPHLFRGSVDESQLEGQVYEEDLILTLSPINAKAPPQFYNHIPSQPTQPKRTSPFQYTRHVLDKSQLVDWTPEMVAQSMLNAGIDVSMADRFIENDINGPILITLKFEDLRELDIPSFGIRTRVWHQIQALRDNTPPSTRPETPIEDAPSQEARHDGRPREKSSSSGRSSHDSSRRRQRRNPSVEDIISPMESVSIIGIEQVIPKPHVCSKGENCSKWRKQQRLIENFRRANPNVDLNTAGTFLVAGDAGNPETARALDVNEQFRPFSDAIPSVVASSDVMGTDGIPALQYLQEATMRNAQARDAQDNVRKFLAFQMNAANEVPPTPPFEVVPAAAPGHQGLRRLPRLSIPVNSSQPRPAPPGRSSTAPPQQQYQPVQVQQQQPQKQPSPQEFIPYPMDKADPRSPDLETPRNPYRFGTPFSEMDVPVTSVPLGPVARDASQSVPPDMSYRMSPSHHAQSQGRSQSRTSARRPSFPVLPVVDEHKAVRATAKTPSPKVSTPPSSSSQSSQRRGAQAGQAPPKFSYPWSSNDRSDFESTSTFTSHEAPATVGADGISFQGPMKKRKMRLLRHEWQDGYFTLKGSRLNMHKDENAMDRTLEYVDIDDYAIACSSLASTSKLSAAFKAVHISHNREKSDPVGAFSFQLVPQDKEKTSARLRKRESSVPSGTEGVNGTGKTHHFAVKNRDERIDWMRELMLAKAMKQKGDGYEVNLNGNMI